MRLSKGIGFGAHLQANTRDLILLQLIILNDVCQCTTFHELHNNPQIRRLDQESIQEVDNVRVLRLFHNHNLGHNELLSRLLGQIHLFNCDFLVRNEVLGDIDLTGRTEDNVQAFSQA